MNTNAQKLNVRDHIPTISKQECYEMAQDQLIMACEDLANQAQKDQRAFQRATAEVAACLQALKAAQNNLER